MPTIRFLLAAFACLLPASLAGQKEAKDSTSERPPADKAEQWVTRHSITIGGKPVSYVATAGTLIIRDSSDAPVASFGYIAYTRPDVKDPASRPLTFAYNGGPGSSSIWLHMGALGPRRVAAADGSPTPPPPYRLADNEQSLIDRTDLVMIDPVGSGWSRAAKPDGASAFWGVRRDAEAMAKTIALYLANNQRSASPKYLLGESYGGFRAAKVARALKREQGITVSGIVMVSPLIESALIFGGTRFALGAALQLPSLAAAELERRGAFSKEKIAEAEHFALNDYLTTLAGPAPRGEAGRAFYGRVADITGLPLDIVTRSRGFIRDAYVKNLRVGERKIVSRYDATFAADDPFPDQQQARGPDPLLDGITRAYGSAFATYAREELGFKTEMTYVLLATEVSGKWDWDEGGGRANASVSEDIRELLALDSSFRLLIAHGYSDMVTPYAVSQYVLNHLPQIGEGDRAELRCYRGGHMFYIDAESRRSFSADAKAFYAEP